MIEPGAGRAPPVCPKPVQTTSSSAASAGTAGVARVPEGTPEAVAAVILRGAEAWPDFIHRYSPFMLSCIRRYANEHDEQMAIYVHVCERLAADDCRRIREYRGRGSLGECKFSTWLAAVVFNLAREWIRTSRGRRRLFRSIRELGRVERLVFKHYFWDGYSVGQIMMLLRSKGHRRCSVKDVVDRLATIERALSQDHRWRLVTSLLRSVVPMSIDQPRAAVGDEVPFDLPDDRAGCDDGLERAQAQQILRELIEALPDDERLAIRLRFERGLRAREVAAALGLRNHKRVYEVQGRALATLAAGLRERGIDFSDFSRGTAGTLDFLK